MPGEKSEAFGGQIGDDSETECDRKEAARPQIFDDFLHGNDERLFGKKDLKDAEVKVERKIDDSQKDFDQDKAGMSDSVRKKARDEGAKWCVPLRVNMRFKVCIFPEFESGRFFSYGLSLPRNP